jgi:hypothetical protein
VSLKKCANTSTKTKPSLKTDTDKKVLKFESSINENVSEIDPRKIEIVNDINLDPILAPLQELKDLDAKSYWEFKRAAIATDLQDETQKLLSISVWDHQFEVYKQTCKVLGIDPLIFDGSANIFEKNKDKLAQILSDKFSNTALNGIMYGTKRIMVELMNIYKDPKLNCIIYFLMENMMDILQIKELLISTLGGKSMLEYITTELVSKIEQLELKYNSEVFKQKKVAANNIDMAEFKEKMDKLQGLVDGSIKKLANLSLVVNKSNNFASEIKKNLEANEKANLAMAKTIDLLKMKPKTVVYANNSKIFGMIRKLNARCQGLNDKIDNLASKMHNKVQHSSVKKNNSEEKLDSEWESVENSIEEDSLGNIKFKSYESEDDSN